MRASLAALGFLLAACALTPGADAPAPFTQTEAPAAETTYPISVDLPAGTYRLDPRHASVIFRIRHMQLAWFTARIGGLDATLEFNPDDPSQSRLTAQANTDAVDTNVEGSFDAQIGRALGGGEIRFVSTHIERTGRHTARVTGDLTMNGQTHPATLDVTFAGGRADPLRGGAMVLGFSAQGVIDRTQWGVTTWRAFAGDDVHLIIEAELVRA